MTTSDSTAQESQKTYIKIITSKGEMIALLYDETPKHKENFAKLVKDKFYDGTLFHRVIQDFMIQGGDPNSKTAKPGEMLGMGGLDYMVDFEFQDHLFHKKGALAAARNNNPLKKSSACQFYIVDGKKVNDRELIDIQMSTGMAFQDYHKEVYSTLGGVPFLDRNYTVFGEVVEGLDVIDKIAEVQKDMNDRPVENVQIVSMEILNEEEIGQLEKRLK